MGGGGWRLPLACIPESGGERKRQGCSQVLEEGCLLPRAPHHRQIPALSDGLLFNASKFHVEKLLLILQNDSGARLPSEGPGTYAY